MWLQQTVSGLYPTLWLYHHSFSRCWLPNLRNPREILRKFLLIAVQGHSKSSNLMPIESVYATSYWSLIVTLDVSPTVFVRAVDV